jgi:hypothetical protein
MKKLLTILPFLLLVSHASAQATAKNNQAKPADNSRSAVGGILISPLLQRVSCAAGRKAEVVFVTENPGTVVETAQAEILSFTMEDWTYRTIYGTDHPRDCAAWFTNKTNDITVQPGQRLELHLELNVPRGAAGPYWCMLKFTPRPNGSQTKSLVVYEIPIVFIIGKNPKPVVKIGTPFLRKMDPKSKTTSMMAVLPMDNDSEGFSVLGATGTLRNASTNRVLNDFIVEDRNLMPKTKREMVFVIPAVPDGRYKIDFKPELSARTLPTVSSEVIVAKGVPKLATEAMTMETTPVTAEPNSINLSIPAGGQRSTTIKVTNSSNRAISLDVKPASIEQAANGSVGIGDSPLPFGLGVEVSGDLTNIQPGQSATARVRILVPKEAVGDLWFGLSIKESGNGASMADSILGTISVPKTEKPGLAVEEPFEVKDGAKTLAFKFKVHNLGNVALRPEGNASVLADGIRLVDRLLVPTVGDGGLLPGKTVENMVMLPPNLKPGSYVVEVAYQYTEQDYGRIRLPFKVVAGKPTAKPTKPAAKTGKSPVKP